MIREEGSSEPFSGRDGDAKITSPAELIYETGEFGYFAFTFWNPCIIPSTTPT